MPATFLASLATLRPVDHRRPAGLCGGNVGQLLALALRINLCQHLVEIAQYGSF